MSKFKIGDKVETEKGIGIIVAINGYEEQLYIVEINDIGKWGFSKHRLKPYRTAHEKLINLGWSFLGKHLEYKQYEKYDKNSRRTMSIRIYKDHHGIYYFLNNFAYVEKELSKILTQYLEELEMNEYNFLDNNELVELVERGLKNGHWDKELIPELKKRFKELEKKEKLLELYQILYKDSDYLMIDEQLEIEKQIKELENNETLQ